MSKYFVIIEGQPTRDLIFRKYKSMHVPGDHLVYHVDFGDDRMGFVSQIIGRDRGRWTAFSFSLDVPKHMRNAQGFATRTDAAFYIAKTYGWGAEE